MVWFLGRKRKTHDRPSAHVPLKKNEGELEARRAVRESAARQDAVTGQRRIVERVVDSLAEVRRNNHFGDNIRAAMGGDK
ncbi:hypothetical protein HOU95_gp028 [Streptomyces phage Hiyaa]|uniref:Uncharacterized protein n=1 Tax=Streptomyces phage Hiyaa TaxID=2499072 RepID=A0A3S9U8R8_9CAUD|nr:hypothetical protein HOU95_gp028 [Streptomyces phage Hiyaa]AZS06668.1 hypothetical protein SEA_HIYAA_28 [Streptomyces phage Hiyaa]